MKKLKIKEIFESEINKHILSIDFFLKNNFDDFKKFLDFVIKTVKKGNKIILFGNGGSASDAQHIAAELVVKYKKKRKSIPAISLSTDTSALTAIGNDFSFNEIFSRQIESIGKPGDIAIGITTSGKSKNVINALKLAKKKKIISVILTKKKYPNKQHLKKISDLILGVPANETARIQELHILVGHLMCAVIDEVF
jgi:D-sedoheptulose 7-phosphate isomerase|tara:strand:+ start:37 stop:624 length:588 start_codon:yes stop_codon:yes gene_type:complete